jgi:acyl-CoA hydrolase
MIQSPPARRVQESAFTLSQFMLPEHSNSQGRVHGGVVLKLCDECGGIVAARHARRPVVTVTVDSVTFHRPIELGSLLLIHGRLTYVGTTSLEVELRVESENLLTGEIVHTNSAYFVYVALDENRRPTPVPSLEQETDDERRRFEQGRARQTARIQRSQS